MRQSTCFFTVPTDGTLDDVLAALHQRFRIRADPSTLSTRRYFDSFDWLLYDAGTSFYQEVAGKRKQLCWKDLADASLKHTLAAPIVPRFARDLPPGPFRDDLAPVLGERALLPLAEVRYHRRVYRVLDDNDKTVARLVVQEDAVASNGTPGKEAPLGAFLHVLPVKGYDEALEALCAALREQPGLVAADNHLLSPALDAVGRTPGDTASKRTLVLDPEQRADEAVKHILHTLLDTIVLNEPGVRADLDSEFLHDFRVAVRRTRSVLGQLKAVLPPDALTRFRPEFKWLGGITGPTRDLDVYLIKIKTYLSWLPASVQEDLTPLRAFLDAHQKQEHALLVEALDTPRYRTLLADWRAFLEAPVPDPPPSPEAPRPVLQVASERIWRAYKKVLKRGTAIVQDPRTPAARLHELRILCKKLRYLLELFQSLYPPETIKKLIQALKRLQDNLGDFNDFEVQQDQLHQFAIQMMREGDVPAVTLLALGRLEARLETLQHETRQEFNQRFTRFASRKNRQRFKDLFKRQAS